MTTFSTQSTISGDGFDLDFGFWIDHQFYTLSPAQSIALLENEYVLSKAGIVQKEAMVSYYVNVVSQLSKNPTYYVWESRFTIDMCMHHNQKGVEAFSFISQHERNAFLAYIFAPKPYVEHWFLTDDPNVHLAAFATDTDLFFQLQNGAVTVQESVYQFTKGPFQQKMRAATQRTVELIREIHTHLQKDYFNFQPPENVSD
jgi:hypothetical protein